MNIEHIWDQIYDTEAEPPAERARMLDTLLCTLKDLANTQPSKEVFYAIGYICYVHPVKSDEMNNEALVCLLKACDVDPSFASPKLYLGHFFYDKGSYSEALGYFREASKASWSDYYRLILEEMVVCCEMSLSGIRKTLGHLQEFVAACLIAGPLDMFPLQLVRCCLRVFSTSKDVEAMNDCLKLVRELVVGLKQESIFQEDLDRLTIVVEGAREG